MIGNYLQILQDSLVKKLELLTQIEEKSKEQKQMIKASEVDLEAIDANMDEKNILIQEVLKLDDGFESLYQRIRTELADHKDEYKSEIAEIKDLISKVTEKSASIRAIEARNKSEMDLYFGNQKKSIKVQKNAMSVARDYYQNMNKVKSVSPQFLDQKK